MGPEFSLTSLAGKDGTYKFSGRGEIYSFTTVYVAPEKFEKLIPYTLALVRLEEGPLMTAQLTDLDWHWETEVIDGEERQVKKIHVEIGMPVEMTTKYLMVEGDSERGLIVYGSKFRPRLIEEVHSK